MSKFPRFLSLAAFVLSPLIGRGATTDLAGNALTNTTPTGSWETYIIATTPTVTTPTAASVAQTTVTLGGNVTADGGVALTERGVVYAKTSLNNDPQIGGSNVTKLAASGTSTGTFTAAVTGLTSKTGYSYKAYATNSQGTSYTSAGTFTTLASTNADLAGLTISQGTLSPIFAAGTTSYTVSVGNAVTGVTLTPTLADSTATVKVDNATVASGNASGNIGLLVGANTIDTVVTAQDGTTTKTYSVVVTRAASSDATLSNLVLSTGTLSPTFDAGTTSYTTTVSAATASLTVTPTLNNGAATVKVNGSSVTSGNASGSITLNVGDNTITVGVTAQDGTTNSYVVTVTRPASADVAISLSASPSGTVAVDHDLTYTLTVANNGAQSAANVQLSDTLPAGLTFVSLTQDSGPTFSATTPAAGANGAISASIATLNSGTSAVFTLVVHVSSSVTDGSSFSNTAVVSTDTTDTNSANDVATASNQVDAAVPTLSSVTISSSNANHARAKTNDVVTLTFAASETIGTPTVTLAGQAATAAYHSDTNTWVATHTMAAGDAEGPVAFSINFADTAGNNGTTVAATTDSTTVTFDKTAPTVAAANITISGASGTGGAFRIGDTITATWNNTGSGDNNSDISTVTVNFLSFGGSLTSASNSGGTWTASYTIAAGSKDATNANVSLIVRDTTGNSTTIADDANATIDNIAPVVTAAKISLNASSFKIGDTITATWDNTATGDNNADTIAGVTVDFSAFGGGSAVVASNSSGTWTASYTVVAGSIEGSNLNASVTATDNAGNTTKTAGTTNATLDNVAPSAPSTPDLTAGTDSGASTSDNITNVTTPTFTGTATTGATVKLYDGATQIGATTAAGGTWSITSSTLAEGTHSISAKEFDAAGNASVASGALTVVIDTTAPDTVIATNPSNPSKSADATFTFSGSDAGAGVSRFEAQLDGTGFAATTSPATVPNLADGSHTVQIRAIDVAGNIDASPASFTWTIDTVPPTLAISAISTDNRLSATEAQSALTISGTTSGAEDGRTVTVTLNSQSYTGSVSSNAWSVTVGTSALGALSDQAYTVTADVSDTAGNAATQATRTLTVDKTAPTLAIAAISSDDRLNATEAQGALTISGTSSGAEDGRTVTVTLNGQSYTGTVASNAWSVTVGTSALGALGDQGYTVTADVSDLTGNAATQATRTLTVDKTAPTVAISAISSDNRLNVAEAGSALTISGTSAGAEDGRTVTVTLNGQSYTGSVSANAWSVSVGTSALAALSDQDYTVAADVSDTAGNAATQATRTLTVDKTAPTIAISAISSDDRLNATEAQSALTISGTSSGAEDGRTVTVVLNGQSYTGSVSSNAWSVTVGTTALAALADQNYIVTADVSDLAGNPATQAARTLKVDTAKPNAPVVATISDDTGSATNDGITKDNTLTLAGTAEANSSVQVFRGGTSIGTTTANGGGAWTLDTTATTLADAQYAFTAKATDAAGNTSDESAALNVTVDTTAPGAPVVASITDDRGDSTTDGITSDNTLAINGTAEANSTVEVSKGGAIIGTTTANGTGAWTFDYAGTTLADGDHSFTANATDKAGNTSGTSNTLLVTIDTQVNAPVVVAISTDTGAGATDGVTKDNTLMLAGTAEANSTVTLVRSGVTGAIGTATANSSGVWSYDYTATTLADGSYIFTARATDVAGNTSAASADFPVLIDTAAPTITSATTTSGTYRSAFSFTLVAPTAVSFSTTTLPAGLSLDTATGIISGTPTTSGTFNIDVTATDLAGNASTGTLAITLAKIPVTVSGLAAQNKTYDGNTTATLTGTAVPVGILTDDTATVTLTGTPVGTFDTSLVASGKTVSISGLSLTGAAASNYTFTAPTATATITAKALTVNGVSIASKTYDGTTSATLVYTSPTFTGVVSPDVVTLVTSGATASFATPGAGTKSVTIAGLTLGGAAAANYTLTQPAATGTITPATAVVTLSNLSQVYTGGSVVVAATTAPAGLPLFILYNNAGAAPVNAGSYSVLVSVTDPNYVGAATGTLVVAKAPQTVTFAPITLNGSTATLSANASSGLPVTFSVISGTATISGNTLTVTAGSPVTVRATQAGNANLAAGFADQSVTTAKQNQTIVFAPLGNASASGGPITLSANATSGLPVSFTVVSGPAVVNGSQLSFTGTSGTVVVRASQAGNATYNAAPDVTQSFNVFAAGQHQVFFGFNDGTDYAAYLADDGKSGVLLCTIAATGEQFVVEFTVNADGTFEATVAPLGESAAGPSPVADGSTPRRAAATALRTFRGRISGGTFSASIVELGINLSTTAQPLTGPTANISGLYQSSAVNSAGGRTASIVGTQGQVLVIATTDKLSTGGVGTVTSAGTFEVQAPGATISGSVDAPTTTVSGTIIVPNQPAVPFSGLATTTVRTDRLINLSSRARIGPAANRTLITGFVIGGTSGKRVLLRAVGPALGNFGITGALGNPRLQLYNAQGQLILENDDWSGSDTAAAFTQVGAFGLSTGARDAALLTTLAPGAYTMHVVDGGETGVALAEIYDASANPQGEYQRLINISSRGTVEAGDGVLIGGFVVTGNSPKKVLVRGVGPGLTGFGVSGALADPKLAIYSGQTVIAANNDWSTPTPMSSAQVAATAADISSAGRATGAFTFAADSKDAAIVITLAPGAYTAQVTSGDAGTGVALVEIYEIPE